MELLQKIPIVILDPYLLIYLSTMLSCGTLAACLHARFAVCDHIIPGDFFQESYGRLMQTIDREQIVKLSVPAVEMADLLPMQKILTLNQIATIAAALHHDCMLASDCSTFQRMATIVLNPANVLCGKQVCQRFNLSRSHAIKA